MELVLGRSRAGHDKDEIYLVLGSDGDKLVLVNGKNRTLDKPKMKNAKHVQPIKHFNREMSAMAEQIDRWTDENVRKVIRRYLDCQRQM